MLVLYGRQARAVEALLQRADEEQTLRRYLRRQEGSLMRQDRREALEVLVDVCRDGLVPFETTIGRARAMFAIA